MRVLWRLAFWVLAVARLGAPAAIEQQQGLFCNDSGGAPPAVAFIHDAAGTRCKALNSSGAAALPLLEEQALLRGAQPRWGEEGKGRGQRARPGGSERAVFGADDRKPVDVSQPPYSMIGQLVHTFLYCTASLVYSNIILTNAHCVLQSDFDFLPIQGFRFYLARDKTFVLASMNVVQIIVSSQYKSQAGCPGGCSFADDDWALLVLAVPIGHAFGWLPVADFDPATDNCTACAEGMELSGYSADPACGSGQSQCTHQHCSILDGVTFDSYTYTTGSASFTNTGVSFAIHDCDLQGGASGSPLLDMATSAIYAIQAQSSLSPGLLFVSFPDLTPAAIGLGNKAVPTALFFDVLADTVADLQAKQGDQLCNAHFIPSFPFSHSASTEANSDSSGIGAGPDVFYYVYTSTVSIMSIDTCESDFDTVLGLLTLDENSLSFEEKKNDNNDFCTSSLAGEQKSRLTATFRPGIHYVIVVDGAQSSDSGNYVLNIEPFDLQGNNASMPIVLPSSLPLYDQQTLADFTDDSELGPSGDIFYSLTPLKDVAVTISTCTSSVDTVVAVYSLALGGQGQGLMLDSDDDSAGCKKNPLGSVIRISLQANIEYRIVVDSFPVLGLGAVQLDIDDDIGPPGDAPSYPFDVVLQPSTLSYSAHATLSQAHSNSAPLGEGADLFYRYTPTATMDMTIHTCGSFVDTVLGIYTLNKGLLGTPLASNDDTDLCPNASDTAASLLTFTFHVGILYMIVVDSKPMESGQIQLSLTQGAPPPDLCGSRLVVDMASSGSSTFIAVDFLQSHGLSPETDLCIIGTSAPDTIVGGPGDDVIFGREGNDLIQAGAGRDTILGGKGKDWIAGDAGKDHIQGGPGKDILDGGKGRDELFGGQGTDTLNGQGGKDTIYRCGNDVVVASSPMGKAADVIIDCYKG